MQVRKLAVTGVVALGSFTALGLSAPAFALCDSYSGGCPTPPPAGQGIGGVDEQPFVGADEAPTNGNTPGGNGPVQGSGGRPGSAVTPAGTPSALPFTGGELVLLTTVGVGALVGGTALVIAGRRRGATA